MPVRKTESRIPQGLQASDLGQAAVGHDGRCTLVSYISSPLVTDRENVYVLFVTDPVLAAEARSFEWSVAESEGEIAFDSTTTDFGEFVYAPKGNGQLDIAVRVLDGTGVEQASASITQEISVLNDELELLIASATDQPGPDVGNSDAVRELVNDLSLYYQNVSLQTPEPGDGFQRFVYGMVGDGTLQRAPQERRQKLDDLAASLNRAGSDYATLATEGLGVCAIRLGLLAMVVPQVPGGTTRLLNWTELPDGGSAHAFADEQLRNTLAALDEAARIDLFNLVRFPKSNITQCGRILETLRDRYFKGANFNDVLTGMSGTRAFWITRHYREGPLLTK